LRKPAGPITPRHSSAVSSILHAGTGRRIQAKLRVNTADDPYEQEADRVAEQVMRMSAPGDAEQLASGARHSVYIRRQCRECKEALHRFPAQNWQPEKAPQVSPDVASRIMDLRGGGKPFEPAARNYFESRFGYDFSQVRIHTGPDAAQSARSINAKAYTTGQDIVFDRGYYAPACDSGKRLLAHELAHVVQQQGTTSLVQRLCNPALLGGRSAPVFFPQQTTIVDIYAGVGDLRRWTPRREAVGLIQQALVDLGYNLGPHGPRSDGVDRIFGPDTEGGIQAFQSAESISGATPGVVDQATLKCLDEVRSKRVVPSHQNPVVTDDQYRIDDQRTGGRDEDIFFAYGSSTLDAQDRLKIGRMLTRAANPLRGCPITLEGFISEDEMVDFGPTLATRRISRVSAEFSAQNHDNPGPACPVPLLPLRTLAPHPGASTGVSDYPGRRKVEVVPAGASSTTTPCPAGSPQFRSLDPAERTVLISSINTSVGWINTALGKLVVGDADGDGALNAYFGGLGRRTVIRSNLVTWRNHLDTTMRSRNRHGTQCNTTCRTAIAFNQGRGTSAWMTLCPQYFLPLSIHTPLSQDEKKAFVLLHEAGHGSIGTRDIGYGHRRLIEFLNNYPAQAENNTDSYTLMILCLNGFSGFCSAPSAADTSVGMTVNEGEKARRGLAWLETWLTWAQQDTSGVYKYMNRARQAGSGLNATNSYYGGVYDPPMVAAFDIHRPTGDPPPTMREQTMVAAVLDRILTMRRASRAGLTVEKDTGVTPVERWSSGPGRDLFLIDSYFLLGSDRDRVERLLPLIITAHGSISAALRTAYATYIKDNVRANRGNQP